MVSVNFRIKLALTDYPLSFSSDEKFSTRIEIFRQLISDSKTPILWNKIFSSKISISQSRLDRNKVSLVVYIQIEWDMFRFLSRGIFEIWFDLFRDHVCTLEAHRAYYDDAYNDNTYFLRVLDNRFWILRLMGRRQFVIYSIAIHQSHRQPTILYWFWFKNLLWCDSIRYPWLFRRGFFTLCLSISALSSTCSQQVRFSGIIPEFVVFLLNSRK